MIKDLQPTSSSTGKPNSPIDGSKVKIPPDILNFITMDDMAVRQAMATAAIVEVRNYFRDRTPQGRLYTDERTITDEETKYEFATPLQSLTIINDGANTVHLRINDRLGWKKSIKSGESNTIDFEVHTIEEAYLFCDTGDSTTIRLEGLY